MIIHLTKPLFAWDCIEDSPTLQSIITILRAIPDAALLGSLVAARGHGRNDYPVSTLWGTLLLAIILRHPTMDACIDELRRNAPLRHIIQIESEDKVPDSDNLSRFLAVLGQEPHLTHLRAIFDFMAKRLGAVVPDLGVHTAGDSTALAGRKAASEKLRDEEEKQGLPQPTGGRKEYKDDHGKITKIIEWFGYKLHLLVDVKHEAILSYCITNTKIGDTDMIPALVEQAERNLPENRIETLAYDKAADDGAVHEYLHEKRIKPLIQNREFNVEEPEKVVGGRTPLHVVYDQAGTIHCYDNVSDPPVRRKMAYMGHEANRGTLKYRCPARYEGFVCPSDERCNEGKKYGMTVRIKQDEDLRRFPSIPRGTKQFEERYKGRTAVERVNARLKVFWGIDDGQVYGSRRFHAQVGAVLVVHLAMATLLAQVPRREGTLGKLRLSPIAQALGEMIEANPNGTVATAEKRQESCSA